MSDDNSNVVYPAQPASFLIEDFLAASNGRYYHAIIYGKNVMGGYADKLSYEERWQVIHWIRALQAKDQKLAYDENVNTLNPDFGTPVSQLSQMADHVSDEEGESHGAGEAHGEEGEHDEGDHDSEDHSEGEHE